MVFGLISNEFIGHLDSKKTPHTANWVGQDDKLNSQNAPKLLACLVNLEKGKIHTLSEDEIVIGRSSACEILINTDATVSRRHAIVTMSGGEFYLQDLGSRNGTSINGETTVKNSRVKLSPDDQISIGNTIYVFSPIGISEALYGSQLKEITFKSRVDLSSKAARKLVTDLINSIKKSAVRCTRFGTL